MTEAIHYTNLIEAARLAETLGVIRGMKELLNLRTSPDSEVTISLVSRSAPLRVGDAMRVVHTMEESIVVQLQALGIDTTEKPETPCPKKGKKALKNDAFDGDEFGED